MAKRSTKSSKSSKSSVSQASLAVNKKTSTSASRSNSTSHAVATDNDQSSQPDEALSITDTEADATSSEVSEHESPEEQLSEQSFVFLSHILTSIQRRYRRHGDRLFTTSSSPMSPFSTTMAVFATFLLVPLARARPRSVECGASKIRRTGPLQPISRATQSSASVKML